MSVYRSNSKASRKDQEIIESKGYRGKSNNPVSRMNLINANFQQYHGKKKYNYFKLYSNDAGLS